MAAATFGYYVTQKLDSNDSIKKKYKIQTSEESPYVIFLEEDLSDECACRDPDAYEISLHGDIWQVKEIYDEDERELCGSRDGSEHTRVQSIITQIHLLYTADLKANSPAAVRNVDQAPRQQVEMNRHGERCTGTSTTIMDPNHCIQLVEIASPETIPVALLVHPPTLSELDQPASPEPCAPPLPNKQDVERE